MNVASAMWPQNVTFLDLIDLWQDRVGYGGTKMHLPHAIASTMGCSKEGKPSIPARTRWRGWGKEWRCRREVAPQQGAGSRPSCLRSPAPPHRHQIDEVSELESLRDFSQVRRWTNARGLLTMPAVDGLCFAGVLGHAKGP